jgi:hypothetical protein
MSLSVLLSAVLFVSLAGGIAYARGLLHLRPSFTCSSQTCDGSQPGAFGCQNDPNLKIVWKFEVNMGNGGGLIELMYSPQCGTNWARIAASPNGGYPLLNVPLWIERKQDTTNGCTAVQYRTFTPFNSYPFPYDGAMVFAPNCQARAGVTSDQGSNWFSWTPFF